MDQPKAPNHWYNMSELARTGRVPQAGILANSEICPIMGSADESESYQNFRICPSTRSAQHGPEAAFRLYQQLLLKSKVGPTNAPMLREKDQVIIIDMNCHSGDHAIGSILLSKDAPNLSLRHIMIQTKGKASSQSIQWCNMSLAPFSRRSFKSTPVALYIKCLAQVPGGSANSLSASG